MDARAMGEAAVLRFRAGDLPEAATLVADALALDPREPYAAGAALLVASAVSDGVPACALDPADMWARVRASGDPEAIAAFGGAYALGLADALGAREVLSDVFRCTPPLVVAIEAVIVAADRGDSALHAAVLARIESIARNAPDGLRAAGDHAAALIARANGDGEGMRRAAARAQRAYARAGWRYYVARAAELAGDTREALRAYRRLGATRDAQRQAAREREIDDPLAALAPRERDVARAIAAGLANKDIAQRLGISVKTVEKNVTAIYAKLGVVRRVQLAQLLAPKHVHAPLRGHLPLARTPFVGRRAELAELQERVQRHRLVSLVGPGGSGKTRLAGELAGRAAAAHSGGAWFIDLTTITDTHAVWPLIATTIGIPRDAQRPVDATVIAWLAERGALLVLDNAEHLLPAIARTVHALLDAGRDVRIIVTSRDRVGVFGENVYRVGPMHVADGAAFFREKAAAAGAAVDDERIIGTICDRLDCIPLAIELAAARLYDLSIGDLMRAIEQHVPVLATADVGIPARHHSVDALVEWGYAPLPPSVQRAFRCAAVFAGTFPLEAARAVLGPDARADLERLARAALVDALPSGAYRMLQVVRDVAFGKLIEHGEAAAAMQSYIAYYDALLRGADEAWFVTPIAQWLEPLKADSHNILRALQWTLGDEHDLAAGVRMAAYGARVWSEMAREPEFEPLLVKALGRAGDAPPQVRLRLHLARSRALDIMRAGDDAMAMARRALDDARESGDAVDLAMGYLGIGSIAATMRDHATAREHLGAALAIFRTEHLKRPEASVLTALAIVADSSERRVADFLEVLGIARALGDLLLEAITLSNVSIAYTELGENETARRCVRDAVTIFERLEAPTRLARARIDLARAEFVCGNMPGAVAAAADALRYFAELDAALLGAECAVWIAKALAPADAANAARFYGYAEAARRRAGDALDDPIAATLVPVLGEPRFAALASEGATAEASALLDALSIIAV